MSMCVLGTARNIYVHTYMDVDMHYEIIIMLMLMGVINVLKEQKFQIHV